MNVDFAAILLLILIVTGIIWLVDKFKWSGIRQQALEKARTSMGGNLPEADEAKLLKEPTIVEYSKSFFPVILIVLVLRSFLVEPFRIPSGSMMPTLLDGDFILVNKFSYGVRLPVVDWKVIPVGEPQRGDVVVFRFPKDPSIDFIKRVIGLPGDIIEYRDKILYVNGTAADQSIVGSYLGEGAGLYMTGASERTEKLDAVEHAILINGNNPSRNIRVTVPEGQYFVMGDNRDHSNDSRFWGFVPEENLVGRAFMIWMNFDEKNDGFFTWSRIGDGIQ